MAWFYTILGITVAAVGLNDIFHTLLKPSGRGRLSFFLVSTVWRISRRAGHKRGTLTGPLAVITVITVWALLQTVGWALVYYPHIPEGFSYAMGVEEARYPDWAEAVYFSMVTLSTLGYGDTVAINEWLRPLSPLQAVTGFAVLTAAVSWFMQIYPALARRRALAIRLTSLREVRYSARLAEVDAVVATQLLVALANDIVQVRVDLTQNSETYYFRETDAGLSLAASTSYAHELCSHARLSQRADVRLGGEVLESALDGLASFLKTQFRLTGNTTAELLDSFASDHGFPGDWKH